LTFVNKLLTITAYFQGACWLLNTGFKVLKLTAR